jgi:hypothetical protein
MLCCLLTAVAKLFDGLGRTLRRGITAPHHPEHRYKRGQRAKWRDKHPGVPVA